MRAQGIKPEMAVVSSKGIVGIVKNVSENFCTVSSLLHKQTRISVNLKHDPFKGGLSWDGTNYKYGIVSDIEKHVKLKVGDTIETSGYSSIFPKGILVGIGGISTDITEQKEMEDALIESERLLRESQTIAR